MPGGEWTRCDAVAHDGGGRMGMSRLQTAARRVFVAATERDAPAGAMVRDVHSEAVRVQATVNGSARVGWVVAVRRTAPLASTMARRAPDATVASASGSVARIVTFTESVAPAAGFVPVTETVSIAAAP